MNSPLCVAPIVVVAVPLGWPVGSLTHPAWRALTAAAQVVVFADRDPARCDAWRGALREADCTVAECVIPPLGVDAQACATAIVEAAGTEASGAAGVGVVHLVGSRDEAPALASALGMATATDPARHPVTFVNDCDGFVGRDVLDFVYVMDRIVGPGGCPWAQQQSHQSLAPFALEETYELLEAISVGDRAELREELGDVLMQVLFHARVAEDHAHEPFSVDDVAAGIAAKMRWRRPHVFSPRHDSGAGSDVATDVATDVDATDDQWTALKAAEKQRDSCLDGIAVALPALAKAEKTLSRAEKEGLADVVLAGDDTDPGDELLAAVERLRARDIDAEQALRDALHRAEARVRAAEASP